MLAHAMVDECELIGVEQDDFGDMVQESTETLPCRWRNITLVRRGSHQDGSDSDSLVHFQPDAPVYRGAILKYQGEYYKVDAITYAKKIASNTVEFIKCGVSITNLGVS